MSPYLKAHEAYHSAGEPYLAWTEALDFHLQHGLVVSTPEVFLMARRVVMAWPDDVHVSFQMPEATEADGWHVWSAAGPLRKILEIAEQQGAKAAAFQRRTGRVHRYRTSNIEHRTSNAQHRTPKEEERECPAGFRRQHSMFDVRCSMFDVRCLMFDVPHSPSRVSLR